MLLDHYGLSEPPFGLTPHTEFFFSGGERGPILDALLYAIDHEDGIVQVAGEVGTGKTMLARMLLERLPPSVQAIYLANPSLGRDDMLSVLATELQVEPASERTVARIRGIEERLVELYAAGRRILLIIDEAHTMPADTLELIRLLANLETTRHKLLRILLFAQPELDALLARPDMRQLKDRITQRFMLRPLDRTEFASYLRHRLTRAGYRGPDLFSPAAVGILHRASGGLVRRTHVLAGKALLAAYAQGRHAVGRREAEAAIQDANGKRRAIHPAYAQGIGFALLLAAAAAWYFVAGDGARTQSAVTASPVIPPANTTPASSDPFRPPTADQVLAPRQLAAPDLHAPAAPKGAPQRPAEESQPAGTAPLAAASLQSRLAATRLWLADANDNHWFIQLQTTDAAQIDQLLRFVHLAERSLKPEDIRVYRRQLGERVRFGVIYGDFAQADDARAAIAALPPDLRAYQPHVRRVRTMR